MKILCSADWHLDAPLSARDDDLRHALLSIPGRLAALCRAENCDLVLLCGDIFDGPYTLDSLNALRNALTEMAVPVFIAPGNHDHLGIGPWTTERFPENVHIFTEPRLTAVRCGDVTVYGAGYSSMDCPALLEGFRASEENAICVLHGDPTNAASPNCPVTRAQAENSNLRFLALGHIHKSGAFTAGRTLCAWPGCPMGRGFDEPGAKGAYIVTLGDTTGCRFVTLDTPRFFDLTAEAGADPAAAVDALLPAADSADYYRITLTGESDPIDLPALLGRFAHIPHLTLRDRTTAPLDIWGSAGEDTFEGTLFALLKQQLDSAPEAQKDTVLLSARICRQLLSAQEVKLP